MGQQAAATGGVEALDFTNVIRAVPDLLAFQPHTTNGREDEAALLASG